MTYLLAIGDRAYSSWSLRAWLLFDAFGLPVQCRRAQLYTPDFAALLTDFPPARTVPALKDEAGMIIAESLAIAEELASRHPLAGIWPELPSARAAARMLVAEMHAGFTTLRQLCPMNLRRAYRDMPLTAELRADLDRLEELWDWARAQAGAEGPWLFGSYCAADAFFAPVAARIAGYGLPVSADAQAYVAAHLAHPSFRRWRAMGLVDGPDQDGYDLPYPQIDWPGPAPRAAVALDPGSAERGACENETCPYSGKPVTHFLKLEGRIFGFCNAFCRDKTLADPEAWPAFETLLHTA